MKYPISIFILDVSNSSSEDMGDKLTSYLDEVVNWITQWTQNSGHIKVKHRAGDEIIFVGYGYATAFIVTFFLSRIWKFHDHQPYFGLSFGDIDKELEMIDIEKWIHPLIKQARYANDSIKEESVRPLFKFEMDQFYHVTGESFHYNMFREEFEILINGLLRAQQNVIREQTEIQELVCSAYLILQQQKAVGKFLGKTPATISSHYKKGKCNEIFTIFSDILTTLHSLEGKGYLDKAVSPKEKSNRLMDTIRNHLKQHINVLNRSL